MVMRAAGSDGKKFVCVASQNYVFFPYFALDHSAIL
jgi:hypothetical protein